MPMLKNRLTGIQDYPEADMSVPLSLLAQAKAYKKKVLANWPHIAWE